MIVFEWDDAKAASNRRKHSISFEVATQVFEDPHSLSEQDRIVDGEVRWLTIGLVEGVVVVLVVHTVQEGMWEETVRIISARRATRKERRRYEQNRQKDIG